jgi:hypothetical protein
MNFSQNNSHRLYRWVIPLRPLSGSTYTFEKISNTKLSKQILQIIYVSERKTCDDDDDDTGIQTKEINGENLFKTYTKTNIPQAVLI